MQRPELIELKNQIETVLKLFRPDPDNPEAQAEEIRDLENRINEKLNQVIVGIAAIRTNEPDIRPLILPNTSLVVKDRENALETPVRHQGHGLQRTLVLTLLQILAEIQAEPELDSEQRQGIGPNVVLAIEEPELYMHPQMQRKMRDLLYELSAQANFQIICTTHSPVFLDLSQKHNTIVRVTKDSDRNVEISQATNDLFDGLDDQSEGQRLQLIAKFHPTVNEVFFAKRVALFEERSALATIERVAELTGLFDHYPGLRHDVTLVDCEGKNCIPLFQKVLNHFRIPYIIIHDEDRNSEAESRNEEIQMLLSATDTQNQRYMIGPTDLESILNYTPRRKVSKVYESLRRVEELHNLGTLPSELLQAVNWVYFGQEPEPLVS